MKTENLYTTDCIRTVSGIYVNVFEPTPEMISIEDIAHSLASQCRFAGHLPEFYSVAQHSYLCSKLAVPGDKMGALLHDASEAYMLDMPAPIKRRLKDYKAVEDNLMKVIADKFGFAYPLSPGIKVIDSTLLEIEWNELMLGKPDEFGIKYIARSYAPFYSKKLFMKQYNKLILTH